MPTESKERPLHAQARVKTWWYKKTLFTMALAGLLLTAVAGLWHQVTTAASETTIIYGVNQFREIVDINLNSGAMNKAGTLAVGSQAADQDHNTGYVYYFDRTENADKFVYLNPATKSNTYVAIYPTPLGYYPKRLAFAPDGQLYLMDADDRIYTVDKGNGAITPQGQVTGLVTGNLGGTGDIAFTPEGTLYLATYGNVYTVDLSTNEATLIFADMLSGIGDGVWTGLAYCNGFLYGSTVFFDKETVTVHRIDPDTGVLMQILATTDTPLNDLTSCPTSAAPPPTSTPADILTPTNTSTPTNTLTPTSTQDAPTSTPTHTAVPPTATNTPVPPTPTGTVIPPSTPTAINTLIPPPATEVIDATAESPAEPGATSTPPSKYYQYIPLILEAP